MKNFILFSVFIAFLGIFSASAQDKSKEFPQFTFDDLDGKAFTHDKIQKGIPSVVIFFDPYCEHCQQEAKWIQEMENSFKNINLIFVSTEETNAIAKFKKDYFGKSILTKLYFLRDTKYRFDGFFGYSVAPTVRVYNSAGKLTQTFDTETLPAEILKAVRK